MSRKSISRVMMALLAGIVASPLVGCKAGPAIDGVGPPDHASFAKARANMRMALQNEVGNTGVNVVNPNTIVIGVVDNPNSTFRNASRDPSEMHVMHGNSPTITWVSWDGPFKLHFVPAAGQKSPLQEGDDVVSGGSMPYFARAKIDANAVPGRYLFTVTVDMPDGTKYEDKYCPPIIID